MRPSEMDIKSLGITKSTGPDGQLVWSLMVRLDRDARPFTAEFNHSDQTWEVIADHVKEDSAVGPTRALSPSTANSLLFLPDWTAHLPPSEHTDFFRDVDWNNSALGHYSKWPHCLRLYTHMLWSDPRPSIIYWGPQRIAIYNQHSIPLLGALHPGLMAHSFQELSPVSWESFGFIFEKVERDHLGIVHRSLELPTTRSGYLEETFWDGGVFALRGDRGQYGGACLSYFEVTRTAVRDRRTTLLTELAQASSLEPGSAWQYIHDCLDRHTRDLPMSILYTVDLGAGSSTVALALYKTIGYRNPSSLPQTIDLRTTTSAQVSSVAALLRRASLANQGHLIIDSFSDSMDPQFRDNCSWRGHGEPSRYLVVMPLCARGVLNGCLFLGLNPRRALDDDHENFVHDLSHRLNDVMSEIISKEEAKANQSRLTNQLVAKEQQLRRLVDMVLVGIFEMEPSGKFSFTNPYFWDILGVTEDRRDLENFMLEDWIHRDDIDDFMRSLELSVKGLTEIGGDVRLKRLWQPPQGLLESPPAPKPAWIRYAVRPEIQSSGAHVSLHGFMVDVSNLKWTERIQTELAAKSIQERQNLEEFIDIVSHELRNPLSAILQCADDILTSAGQATKLSTRDELSQVLQSNISAADIIAHCGEAQKRIVDDVLMLGKLNSGIVPISSILFDPRSIIHKVAQMFGREIQSAGIRLKCEFDQARESDAMFCGDPSRISQVLINLITNSIKFMRPQSTREIVLRQGFSSDRPIEGLFGPSFRWYASGIKRATAPKDDEQQGARAYCYFAVSDTGKGIPEYVQSNVCSKFSQGEKRTHVKYGGSGLGLHICRELTELQGGQIGFQSMEDVGSTFGFFIEGLIVKGSKTPVSKTSIVHENGDNVPHQVATLPIRRKATSQVDRAPIIPVATKPISVLLVEDNVINQKVLATSLRKAGLAVTTLDHGGESVDYVSAMHRRPLVYNTPAERLPIDDLSPRPDCILMDWEMPVCDGVRATEQIRAIEREMNLRPTMIIGITANAREEQKAAAIKVGMNTVVTKPFKSGDLLKQIQEGLRQREESSQEN